MLQIYSDQTSIRDKYSKNTGWEIDLEDGGRGGDERERGLNSAGGVGGESDLDELPLQLIGGSGGGGLEFAGELLGAPIAAGASAHEREHSHSKQTLTLRIAKVFNNVF